MFVRFQITDQIKRKFHNHSTITPTQTKQPESEHQPTQQATEVKITNTQIEVKKRNNQLHDIKDHPKEKKKIIIEESQSEDEISGSDYAEHDIDVHKYKRVRRKRIIEDSDSSDDEIIRKPTSKKISSKVTVAFNFERVFCIFF